MKKNDVLCLQLFTVVHMSRSCHSVMVTETGSTDSVSTAQVSVSHSLSFTHKYKYLSIIYLLCLLRFLSSVYIQDKIQNKHKYIH